MKKNNRISIALLAVLGFCLTPMASQAKLKWFSPREKLSKERLLNVIGQGDSILEKAKREYYGQLGSLSRSNQARVQEAISRVEKALGTLFSDFKKEKFTSLEVAENLLKYEAALENLENILALKP